MMPNFSLTGLGLGLGMGNQNLYGFQGGNR
jgi:hypothetical protein